MDPPGEKRCVSRCLDLLHHVVHQKSDPEAGTFWTRFGAERRNAFEAEGEIDPA